MNYTWTQNTHLFLCIYLRIFLRIYWRRVYSSAEHFAMIHHSSCKLYRYMGKPQPYNQVTLIIINVHRDLTTYHFEKCILYHFSSTTFIRLPPMYYKYCAKICIELGSKNNQVFKDVLHRYTKGARRQWCRYISLVIILWLGHTYKRWIVKPEELPSLNINTKASASIQYILKLVLCYFIWSYLCQITLKTKS